MHRIAESSSDGEEMHTSGAKVPYEIRSARRTALTVLVMSALTFLGSVVMVAHKQNTGSPPSAAPLSSEVVGLDQEEKELSMNYVTEGLHGLRAMVNQFQYGIRPSPYHLVASSTLRTGASAASGFQCHIPAGTQVFPLSSRNGWVQVVVPQREDSNATFGWLPEKVDGDTTLLALDTELVNRRPRQETPPSAAEIQKRWDAVKAQNANLKAQIDDLHSSMKGPSTTTAFPIKPTIKTKEERVRGANQIKHEVNQVVDVDELSKVFRDLHTSVKKELQPGHAIDKVGTLFAE